jgi:hypothetical protein
MITLCSYELELKVGEALERALSVLDKALTVETHKIGILFIEEGQTKQEEILSNTHGSPRYLKVSLFKLKITTSFWLFFPFSQISLLCEGHFQSDNLILLFGLGLYV